MLRTAHPFSEQSLPWIEGNVSVVSWIWDRVPAQHANWHTVPGRCEAIWVTISQGKDRRLLPWLEGEGLVSIALADGSKLNLCQNAQVWNIQSSRTDMSPCSHRWSITMIYYSDCFNTDLSGKEWGVSRQVKLGGPAPAGHLCFSSSSRAMLVLDIDWITRA